MIEVRNNKLYKNGMLFGDEKHVMNTIRKASKYDELKAEYDELKANFKGGA